MLVLNRRGPISNLIGGGIGIAKEWSADRKARKASEQNGDGHSSSDEDDIDHEWAEAIDLAQQEANATGGEKTDEKKNVDELITEFVNRHPPPPYLQQQPEGRLTMPVILPQRRPESRTRGFVRAYAPVLADAGVDQKAWMEFLEGFEKSINKNYVFWAANAAVWVADKAYLVTSGVSVWAKLVTLSIHMSLEAGRRGYIHSKQNGYLDLMNEQYFKPRGLYCLIIKYQPDHMEKLGGWEDVRKNVTEIVTKRDDPERTKWNNLISSSSSTTERDAEMPEFAPLVFPQFDGADEKQKENAFKHFRTFMQEYRDRQANARFEVQNPDSRLAGVAPQKEWASKYSNPQHPARQGGTIALMTGGRYNPKGPIQARRDRRKAQEAGEEGTAGAFDDNVDVTDPSRLHDDPDAPHDKNAISWQAKREQRRGPLRRLLRQDVLYLMVVNMPSQQEMDTIRMQLEGARP